MNIIKLLVDYLFPARCVSCEHAGEWWCASCRTAAGFLRKNLCPVCVTDCTGQHEHVTTCLDGLTVAGYYHQRQLREMIHALKYQGVSAVMPAVGQYLLEWSSARAAPWPWAHEAGLVIQPLPAAKNRVRERGFDQAHLIADLLQKGLFSDSVRVNLLERSNASIAQASLAHDGLRGVNVRGAFQLRSTDLLPRAVLLIDDVVTTGSSMNEAARLLKERGVERVYGFALAVGA